MRHSIALKMILPVPVVTTLAIIAAWIFLPPYVARFSIDDAISAAQSTVSQFKTLRGYYTENVVAKAVKSGALKPTIDHRNAADGIPLPATMIHDLSGLLEKQGTTIRLYSPYPFTNRQSRTLDDFGKAAWDFLVANPDSVFTRRDRIGDKEVVRVAMSDRMTGQACVNCHNSRADSPKRDWKLNDVRGVLEVVSDVTTPLTNAKHQTNTILIGLVLLGSAIALICMSVARSVSNPLNAITNVMRGIAGGNRALAVPSIGRQDEIGAIAGAVQVFKDNALEMDRLKIEQEKNKDRAETEKKAALSALADSFETSVQKLVDEVAAATTHMHAAIGSMGATAERTATQSDAVATAATQASENVQTVASASEELSASISEIGHQVAASAKIAGRAVEEAGRTNVSVQGLAQAAQKIGDVVKLINDIAGQTNLLALNATIE
ncbi:MAG: DUF3365 domain-containing protein, partial [Rhodospirillales bacterium]|nr:DUF3365 domain-containing protein [Rhodospirillales bacterium]